MAKKKKLYLVWQESGSYDTYVNSLRGIYDNEEDANELKSRLDEIVVSIDDCWSIMPEDVFAGWPTIEVIVDEEVGFEYVNEYMGYTIEQRDEQEDRWVLMTRDFSEAVIEVVNMNEAL